MGPCKLQVDMAPIKMFLMPSSELSIIDRICCTENLEASNKFILTLCISKNVPLVIPINFRLTNPPPFFG